MLKVGLTGSIAVGKSFVLEVFRELGSFVLDADQIAREVVEPGTSGLDEIVQQFGNEVLCADGTLDRKKLSAIVFDDRSKLSRLNSIVHPKVIEKQDAWLTGVNEQAPNGIAIVDAALMIESGGYKRLDKLIVVWCESKVQVDRLMSRNDLSRDDAEKRIASQMSQDEKKRYADFLIDTSKGYEDTRGQTVEIFKELELLI